MNSVHILSGKEALEKVKDYQEHLKNSEINNQSFNSFSVPQTNNNPNKVVNILNLASISEPNIENMEVCVSSILNSLNKDFVVRDVGSLIDALPEIEFTEGN